jgi:hypothetical protein
MPKIHPSRDTGKATSIRFFNDMMDSVELFSIDAAGERQSYGRVHPNDARNLNTYVGHVWVVTDATGTLLGVFEAYSENLQIIVDGPGKKSRRASDAAKDP